MTMTESLLAGCRNMLQTCAGLQAGARLLIVSEDPKLGWYDAALTDGLVAGARNLDMKATVLPVGAPDTPGEGDRIDAASADQDAVIYLARIGDIGRFDAATDGKIRVMSYARTADMLASDYGRADHRALLLLKEAVNDILLGADRIEVTCPLGTKLAGKVTGRDRENAAEVTVRRFPMGVPQPVIAVGFSGRVALARYLTSTGSRPYDPAWFEIETPAFAVVENGRIAGLDGEEAVVEGIRKHYRFVSEKFGIDADAIHSWHAGIHPGCTYDFDASEDPDRWSNNVFTNPRFLHVHTCGAYPPGEICWMILDHTVEVDGRALWRGGRLLVEELPGLRACLEDWPVLAELFANPSDRIGIAA
jgi:hypothetical protein